MMCWRGSHDVSISLIQLRFMVDATWYNLWYHELILAFMIQLMVSTSCTSSIGGCRDGFEACHGLYKLYISRDVDK